MQTTITISDNQASSIQLKRIWEISWPLNMSLLASSNLAEGWIVGCLGAEAQAAVGLGSQIWFLFMMLTLALSAGTTAIVSRYWGAGDVNRATEAARQSLICAIIFGIVATIIAMPASSLLLKLTGTAQGATMQAMRYLQFTILSITPYTVLWISGSIFRSIGNTKTPMVTMFFVTVLIILGDILFSLGPPKLGVSGIGIAWCIACICGLSMNLMHLKGSPLSQAVSLNTFRQTGIRFDWMKRFLRIGLPACLQDCALIVSSFATFYVLSKTPNAIIGQAAWAAGWRLQEVLTIMPMYGLGIAAATIVGQNLGAKRQKQATIDGLSVTILGACICSAISIIAAGLSSSLSTFMASQHAVSLECTEYLRLISIGQPFFACWVILSGAFQGAGYTVRPMLVTVCCFDLFRPACAGLLSTIAGLGCRGVWTAELLSVVLAALFMLWEWHRGRWRDQLT